MAKGKLFEYAILYHPKATKEQRDAGETPKSEIVIEPQLVLSIGTDQVSVLASRAIPEAHLIHLDDIEIVVRPF
jgi:hypothetical protein